MVFHRVITENPPNTGVRVEGLSGESLSQQQMYVRSNLPTPLSAPAGFEVVIPGRTSRFITIEQFKPFQEVTREIVLECAGNGRTLMDPVPEGTAWELDGASPITVTGYRLNEVIGGLPDEVVEVVFTGADIGTVPNGQRVPYQFSFGRELAESTAPILVTHIGGDPLSLLHGAPIRLIVPGHYAMKSVKWLVRVEAVTSPFRGYFVEKYRYLRDSVAPEYSPVGEICVRSVIASPIEGEPVVTGLLEVRGSAWSGPAEVSTVEVSVDSGDTWKAAELFRNETGGRWAPVRWALIVEPDPGELEIIARATDAAGNTQPMEPRWNARGYANNVVQRVNVTVVEV